MCDIFISYRRADAGWANWLADSLDSDFAIFFDTDNIDYGDQFPMRISEALDECRVCLAVIGKGWISEEHLRRLHDAKDWVRKEILALLDRPDVRLVPLLVESAHLPPAEALPKPLRKLTCKQAFSISRDKPKDDLRVLKTRLDVWLAGQVYLMQTRIPWPSVLPYLCNRAEQEDSLAEALVGGNALDSTPVVILHGHKLEEHGGFIDRLCYCLALDDLLGVRTQDVGVALHWLQWNLDLAVQGEYERVILGAIKRNVLKARRTSDQEVQTYLTTLRQPHVLIIHVAWSDYLRCGHQLFEGLIKAWRGLFELRSEKGKHSQIKPPFNVVLWINFAYDEPSQAVSFEEISDAFGNAFCALPILPSLQERDIEEWIKLNEVRRFVIGREERVRGLLLDQSRCIEKGKMHMRCFAEAIREILV